VKASSLPRAHQALDDEASDLLHSEAAHDEGIKAVEGAENAPCEPPALGRIVN